MSQQNNYAGTYGGSSSWTNPGNGLGAPNASLSGLAGDNPSDSYVYSPDSTGLPAYFVVSAVYVQVWMNDGSGGTASLKHSTQTLATQGGGGEYTMGGYISGGPWPSSAWPNSAYVHAHGDGNGNPCRLDAFQFQITWDYVVLNTLLADDVTNYAPTSATINGRYNANGDGDTEYRLVYKASGGSYDTPSWTSASGQTGTVVAAGRNLTSLTPGTTYFYKIQARNTGDVVYESAERTFQTNAGTPAQNDRIREVISRRLWLLRRPTGIYECNVPLSALDADIHDRIDIVSPTGPHAQGIGWRAKEWQRRRFSVQRITIVPGDDSVKLTLLDRRLLDIRLWDTGMTSFANLSGLDLTRANGVARISHGAGRSFSRTTKVWIVNGADSTRVIEMLAETPGIGYLGELFEDARTNYVTRSSGVSGTTGLTLTGTGTNGSAIASDASDTFFNVEMSADPLKFTAGSPHTAELRATWPTTPAFWFGIPLSLTIDHRTDSGEALTWRLQRSADGYYYNVSTPGWQSSAVDNQLPVVASRNPASRYVLANLFTVDTTQPDTVGGLWGWWMADAGVEKTSGDEAESGDTVQYWRDQSGNGRDWSQATAANRPTFVTGVILNRPVLRFDGSNDYLSYAGNPGSAAGEIFIVVKIDNDPPASDAVSGLWDMGTSANDVHFPHPAGTIHDDWGSTTRKDTPNPTPSLSSAFRIYGVRSASGAWTNRIDGTDHYTTGTNTVGWRTTAVIGAGLDAGFYLDGDIAEILIYSNVLSSGDRTIVEAYLKAKYGVAGGPSTTTMTLSLALPSGGTAGRISHVYHAQIEVGSGPTSRIVTDAATYTREKSTLTYDVTTGAKVYDPAIGTFFCEVIPFWNSADLGSIEDHYIFYMETNGGADHDALFFDASTGKFTFERKVGANTYTAVVSSGGGGITRDTVYRVACRWTGAGGELDKPNHSLTVFLNGTPGTDVTSAAPTFTSPETLNIGQDGAAAKQFNGIIRERRIFPVALLDEEIGRLP